MNAATAQLTRERQAIVIEHLRAGLSLREIAALASMPAPATVCGWCKSPAFARRYRAAVRRRTAQLECSA